MVMQDQSPVVLVVDDEVDCREECAQVVQQMGLQTVEAGSADEGLRALQEDPAIAIVLTDVRMPGTDGIAFMAKAQELYCGSRQIQFIVLTGHGSLELAVSAMRYRAVDFLSKPVGRRDIIEAVERARVQLDDMRPNTGAAERRRPDVDALSVQIDQVARMLASLREENVHRQKPAHQEDTRVDAAFVRGLIRSRRLRDRFFPADMFADPAWDILLDLTAAFLESRSTSVSNLCLAASVPPTTALRWIKSMSDAGLLHRRADDLDGRRILVDLAPLTAETMLRCLAQIRSRQDVPVV